MLPIFMVRCPHLKLDNSEVAMLTQGFVLLGTLVLAGCVRNSPLLVPEQAKLMNVQNKELRPYAKPIQGTIRTAGTNSALVITQAKGNPPIVLPGDDPITLAQTNIDAVAAGNSCILVSKSTLAAAPIQLSCSSLAVRAKDALASQSRDEKQDADIVSLRNDLMALRTDLQTLEKSVDKTLKIHDDSIASNRADIDKLAKVLAPTTNIVSFHETQLKKIESMLNTIGKRYQKTAETVGENNKQIESIITDLNSAFAQTRDKLDQIQRKLDTIK